MSSEDEYMESEYHPGTPEEVDGKEANSSALPSLSLKKYNIRPFPEVK